jgi:hypothetical protein
MKKMLMVLAAVAMVVGGAWVWPSRVGRAAVGQDNGAGAQEMVDAFSPWISACILQRWTIANRIFPMENGAQAAMQSNEASQMYARFPKLEDVPLSLVGRHSLGDHIGTALFTAATQDGPIGFKVSYYRFGTETHIGKVEVSTHWSELEALSLTVEPLATPVTAMLQSKPQ